MKTESLIDPGATIGSNLTIGRFSIIEKGCVLGDNVIIGDRVTISEGTRLGSGVIIQDGVLIGQQPKSISTSTFKRKKQKPTRIGDGSLIWGNVIICAGATLGQKVIVADNALIREGTIIGDGSKIGKYASVEFDCTLGQRVVIQAYVLVGEYSVLEDDVFIGPHVSMALDKFMGHGTENVNKIHLKRGAAIGQNSSIMPGVTIGENAIVGAHSLISKTLEGGYVYVGTPPRQVRKVRAEELK